MSKPITGAFRDLLALEDGSLANPDEQRKVGHYWLRNPELAPSEEIREAIVKPLANLREFAAQIHSGETGPPSGGQFEKLLLIGIGGSALGPQFVYDALRPSTWMETFFFDNTDPDGKGRGEKDMVVIPYKDSLVLFSRYLQQLVMESIGKRIDLHGREVFQGMSVYGNKGSTDQHSYVQQLRDGIHNFFLTFIEVRRGRQGESQEVNEGATSADYLQGFLRGTRKALHQSDRHSITLSIDEVILATILAECRTLTLDGYALGSLALRGLAS